MNYIKESKRSLWLMRCIVNIVGILVILFLVGKENNFKVQKTYQEQLAQEILRFHVIANSDSEKDQNLKLKVKEGILNMLCPMLSEATTKNEAKSIIYNHIKEVETEANKIIAKEGYHYKSQAVLGKTTFPIKQYGDMVVPAGEYEAFRILLGEAKGKNWWCIMFPTLCYVDEVFDVITEENKAQFKEILTKEEYESLFVVEELENIELEFRKDKLEEKTFYKLKSMVCLNKVIDYFRK